MRIKRNGEGKERKKNRRKNYNLKKNSELVERKMMGKSLHTEI